MSHSGLRNMGGHRRVACMLRPAAAFAVPVLYARWVLPRLLTWGATHDEATDAYPGDELIPDPAHFSTMATTLPAPPERVWPWLVQMGYDRAGWYSWDKLDHGGKPSADRIGGRGIVTVAGSWPPMSRRNGGYRSVPNAPTA
jgi:hypothetical protein